MLHAYNTARRQHRGLRLILVPRHAERFDDVARWLRQNKETVVRRSELTSPITRVWGGTPPITLIDTIGELSAIWGLADVAFVGGSLHAGRGGQNMMEPAAYGASVMFGPHIANFRETVDQLLKHNAARQVADADELTQGLLADLDDPESAAARAQPAETSSWPSTAQPAEHSLRSTASSSPLSPQWLINAPLARNQSWSDHQTNHDKKVRKACVTRHLRHPLAALGFNG